MLRNTIEKLLDDCERRQALVQELITSSNKLQYVYTLNTFLLVGIDPFYVHFVITAARKSRSVSSMISDNVSKITIADNVDIIATVATLLL